MKKITITLLFTFLSTSVFALANAQNLNFHSGGGWNNDIAPNNCRVWYDGCNTCTRQTPGGPLVCTKIACFAKGQSYCKDYFGNSNGWNNWGNNNWNNYWYPWYYNGWNNWGNNWNRGWNGWNNWNRGNNWGHDRDRH